jgi:hypothetical protein
MKTILYKLKITGLVLLFFTACTSKKNLEKTTKTNDKVNAFFEDLNYHNSDEKLILSALFDECGEWGGHFEKIVIYGKGGKDLYLDYQKYKVFCDSIDKNTKCPIQLMASERTLKLNKNHKKAIFDYIQRMIKSKIEESFPSGHSGRSFSVVKSDSTLVIKVYDHKSFDFESYNKLLRELNLESVKK